MRVGELLVVLVFLVVLVVVVLLVVVVILVEAYRDFKSGGWYFDKSSKIRSVLISFSEFGFNIGLSDNFSLFFCWRKKMHYFCQMYLPFLRQKRRNLQKNIFIYRDLGIYTQTNYNSFN